MKEKEGLSSFGFQLLFLVINKGHIILLLGVM